MTGTENDITSAIKKLHSISLNPLISGLNSSEYFLLKVLMKMRENAEVQGVHVSDIAKRMRISAPSVTKILNSLENKELIIRETDRKSRRNTLVCITDKGILIKRQNDSNLAQIMANVYNRVGRENIVQFLQLSELIHNAIDEEIKDFTENHTEL